MRCGSRCLAALAFAWLVMACDEGALAPEQTAGPSSGSGVTFDAGGGGSPPDAGLDASPPVEAGAPSPVWVGVTPTLASTFGAPSVADQLEAELTMFAAGVRTALVPVAWGDPATGSVESITARVTRYRQRGLHVVLEWLVVDRAVAHRPEELAEAAWADEATTERLHDDLTAVLASVGGELEAVVFGRRTDEYLVESEEGGASLTALLASAVGLVDRLRPELPVGVGVSYFPEPSDEQEALLALGDLAVFSFLPGLGAEQIPTDLNVVKALDTMIAQAAGRPIVVQELGLPSAASLTSSEEQQDAFLRSFFDALAPRSPSFVVVNARELHDAGPEVCELSVVAQGHQPGDAFGAYVCSLGLRRSDGAPKLGWYALLTGAARFATP